jgi:Pyruvate/2-oxoacid:ferredoxin oxidoreductase delta subunit
VRKLSDYPHVSAVHLQVAQKLSNPLTGGPPICDEFIAFVQHLLTEEEAGVMRHLGNMMGKSAEAIARAEHRPVEQVEPILKRLAFEKFCIAATGPDTKRRYKLMPVFPGIFECVLFPHTPETLTDWHRRFAELFEALFETGYSAEYMKRPVPSVRFLPVGDMMKAHPLALPTDQFEILLDRYDTFAVGQCQCRTTAMVLGRDCGKPKGNCTMMGEWAKEHIKDGSGKEVSKKGMMEIKAEAASHGLVSWIINVESTKGQVSCSCCGCCCYAMRQVSEFNTPAWIAPPHFMPKFDVTKCTYCGKCDRVCPMRAISVAPKEKTHRHHRERCVGCGLCVHACDRQHAVAMEPVPDYRLPPKSWFALISRTTPNRLRNSFAVWRKR